MNRYNIVIAFGFISAIYHEAVGEPKAMSLCFPTFASAILLLCVSCSLNTSQREVTIHSDDLAQSNSFVEEISYQAQGSFYAEEMCVAISQKALWEPGDRATQLWEQITSSTTVTIDGHELPGDRIAYQSRPIEISVMVDGKVVGSQSGTLQLCFSVADLSVGEHADQIEVMSSSGRRFTDSWEFVIA